MKTLKIFGIVLLSLISISGGFQLLISTVAMVGANVHQHEDVIPYSIGYFMSTLILEVLVIWGIVKLSKNLKNKKKIEPVN